MRIASRRDVNHREIVFALERTGCAVQDLSRVGGGCPDIAVSFRGVNVFIEIKRQKSAGVSGGRVRESQQRWIDNWKGPVFVVHSAEEALQVIGAIGAKEWPGVPE